MGKKLQQREINYIQRSEATIATMRKGKEWLADVEFPDNRVKRQKVIILSPWLTLKDADGGKNLVLIDDLRQDSLIWCLL